MKSFWVSHFFVSTRFFSTCVENSESFRNGKGGSKNRGRRKFFENKIFGRFYSWLTISRKLKIVTFIFPLKYLSNTYGRYISTLIWGFHILGEIHKEASLEEGLRDPPSPTHTHVPGIETLTKAVL